MFCPECGKKMIMNAKFCSHCGVKAHVSIESIAPNSILDSTKTEPKSVTHNPTKRLVLCLVLPLILWVLINGWFESKEIFNTLWEIEWSKDTDVLSALSSVYPIVFFARSIVMTVALSVLIAAGLFHGSNKNARFRLYVFKTVTATIVIGALLSLVGLLMPGQILRWLSIPDIIYNDAIQFLRFGAMGFFGTAILAVGVCLLVADGSGWKLFLLLTTQGILELVATDLMISTENPVGTLIASLVATYITALVCAVWLFLSKKDYGFSVAKLRKSM